MPRLPTALLCLALIVATGSAVHASPSALVPYAAPGRHAVEHEAFVDIGTFSDCLTWHYVVRSGDTLGEVAQRELGSARRHREILALNPKVNPKRIRAGLTLEMPPRGNGCERGRDHYVFFAWTPASGGWSAPRRLADERIHQIGHGTCLFAVPVDRLSGVCAASGAHPLCARALAKDPKVARTDVLELQATVSDSDPTQRVVTHFRVVGIRDGRIDLVRTGRVRFDAEGRRIEIGAAPGSAATTLLQILVFVLLVASIGLVVGRAQRRRGAGFADEAPADGEVDEDEYEYEYEEEAEEEAEEEYEDDE